MRKAAPTVLPRPFRGQLVPVVLRGVLVRQHLQVDGLGSPLDAPVLQARKGPIGEPNGAPGVPATTGTHQGITFLAACYWRVSWEPLCMVQVGWESTETLLL